MCITCHFFQFSTLAISTQRYDTAVLPVRNSLEYSLLVLALNPCPLKLILLYLKPLPTLDLSLCSPCLLSSQILLYFKFLLLLHLSLAFLFASRSFLFTSRLLYLFSSLPPRPCRKQLYFFLSLILCFHTSFHHFLSFSSLSQATHFFGC